MSSLNALFDRAEATPPTSAAEYRRTNLDALGCVLSRVAGHWYESEYGLVEIKDRWYQNAYMLLEWLYGEIAGAPLAEEERREVTIQ